MKFIANSTRNADRVNRSDMLQSIFADKSVLPSTCRQIHVFLACRFNKDFDFLEILFSKFAGMLHFRRDTRECPCHATPLNPSSGSYSRDLEDRLRISSRGNTPLTSNLQPRNSGFLRIPLRTNFHFETRNNFFLLYFFQLED